MKVGRDIFVNPDYVVRVTRSDFGQTKIRSVDGMFISTSKPIGDVVDLLLHGETVE